jgi:DNA-directed RNA polymerase beta' subunit
MSIYKELAYDKYISRIKGIQFCVLSPDEIRRRSVAEITRTDTYVGLEPVPHGLFDPRMGAIDHNRVCKTCEQKNTFCPGHFGHIELAKPVFYVQFADIVRKLLRCVCFRCSALLVDLDSPPVRAILAKKCSRQKRWEYMSKLCAKVKRCGQDTMDGCGAKQPDKVQRTESIRILMEWKDLGPGDAPGAAAATGEARQQVFSAEDCLRILRRITDEHSEALGFHPKFNRPEWMVCTVLPVPPPAVRPSVRNDTGARSEDDLTHKLSDIVKYNQMLKTKIEKGATPEQVDYFSTILQYHVATLIDNSIPHFHKSMDRTGRAFRSLTDRLRSKEGRIRGNLMGKRVDFSARTVITPDPNLSIDELGVPLRIAMNLTFPEVVNEHNIEEMYRLVRNGPERYPGAKHVRKVSQGNRTVRLKGNDTAAIQLEEGDIVERHLRNGDYVLFNRQPSLHKMSMMAHRVRVMNYNTFRLNVCVCASYNADFDGDEMNLHVPQSLQTHYEIMSLAAVPLHIISPRHSKPIVTIVQDVALGVFRITQGDVRVTHKQLMNLLASNPEFRGAPAAAAAGGLGMFTGRQALSSIIPRGVNMSLTNSDMKDRGCAAEDFTISVRDGVIESGVLSAKEYKDASRGLVHSIYNDRGPGTLTTFLNNTQKLICDWLVLSGFSVGISDLAVSLAIQARLHEKMLEMKRAVYAKVEEVMTGRFENASTKSNEELFESQVTMLLSKGHKEMEKLGISCFDTRKNRMLNMIHGGSKGGPVNFTQMVACVGQQTIDNGRVPDGFEHRTLPHFTKFDDGPEARGFVEHSFIAGLTPQEFFFHSMGGRIGLIDTAVKSVTGDTPILIIENSVAKRVLIGDWIDSLLTSAGAGAGAGDGGKIKLFPEDRNLELLEVGDVGAKVMIPTVDTYGKTSWAELTAVTRHDPGERLYRVTTESGREVTVAESKTLLIWSPDKRAFEPTHSTEVKVGQYVPVAASLCKPPIITEHVDMSPGKLPLDFDNGVFIGLFLADGHSSVECGVGDPRMLAQFLDAFVGKGAPDKHVPDVAFAAPDSFVEGLLSGYFSGAGSIDSSSISISSSPTSKRLAEGISMLCARFGALAELGKDEDAEQTQAYTVTFRAQFAQRLAPHLKLCDATGADKLAAMCPSNCYFSEQEDTVLDRIKSIDIIGSAENPKLYDVTVPSTKNFMAANGVGLFDTSDTGYTQRKLVKAMEDCKVHYDLSVRNAAGHIVQFLYGDDGMDPVKLEYQHLPTVNQQPAKILEAHYIADVELELSPYLAPDTLARVAQRRALLTQRLDAFYAQLLEDKRFLVKHVHGRDRNDLIVFPVHIARIVDNVATDAARFGVNVMSDLDPLHVLDVIAKLERDLVPHSQNKTKIDGAKFMPMLLRAFLSPKVLIVKHRLDTLGFERVVQQVRASFYRALAQPGDMVGIVAAQSIGEPLTQMSQSANSSILAAGRNSGMYHGEIGTFIDGLLERHAASVQDLGGDSVVLDLPEGLDDQFIVGVSTDEKTSWNRILQVSRHPANGGMVKVTTRSGKTTTATLSHSFLTRAEAGVVPILGSDLRMGMRIPVAKHLPVVANPLMTVNIAGRDVSLTRDLGWFFGAYIADGCILGSGHIFSKVIPEYQETLRMIGLAVFGLEMQTVTEDNKVAMSFCSRPLAAFLERHFSRGPSNKRVPAWAYASNGDFIRGLLGGYFDGNGNVIDQRGKEIIRTSSVSEKLTEDIVLLLAYTGIFASKCQEWSRKCYCHTAQISRKYAQRFKDEIGFVVQAKAAAVDNIIDYVNREDRVNRELEHIDKIPELGAAMAFVCKALELPELYKRFQKTDAIGRETLKSYLPMFEDVMSHMRAGSTRVYEETREVVQVLERYAEETAPQATERGTVPLDQSIGAMLSGTGKALFSRDSRVSRESRDSRDSRDSRYSQYQKLRVVCLTTLQRCAKEFREENEARRGRAQGVLAQTRAKMAILYQAAFSDVVWDEIMELEVLPDPQEFVYDFTVPGNDSFMVDCGVLVHNTLNTFHLSGIANKGMQGVPRLKELMSVTKNIKTPCMEVHLDAAVLASGAPADAAKVLASDLQTTRFKDLVTRSRIYYDPDDKESRISDDRALLDFYEQFRALEVASAAAAAEERRVSPWVLRFEFNRAKMLDLNVTMLDLEHVLSDWYDDLIRGTFSDDNARTLLARVRLEYPAGEEAREQDALTELKALEQSVLEKVVVKGVPLVNKAAVEASSGALPKYDDATDAFVAREEVKISTSGSNLVKVLSHDGVDATKTTTNDVCEVYEVLGIEAARLCLLHELQSVMCIGDANNVNYRHMALLVDVMTNRGTLQSIDRHGINRGETGPLAKCSFEETTDMLVKAGIFAELDRINGVSANIMLGQVAPCGTGDCEVLLDDVMMEKIGHDVKLPLDPLEVSSSTAAEEEAALLGPPGGRQKKAHGPEYVAPAADERVQERTEDEIVII